MNTTHLKRIGLCACLLTGLAGCGPAKTGTPAPDFRLSKLEGGEMALSETRGNIVLLTFWAVG